MRNEITSRLDGVLYPQESEHQRDIESYFGDALLRPLDDREVQLLAGIDLFFVAFSNRSGSTLLCELLYQSGLPIPPRAEIFNSESILPVCTEHGIPTFTDYFMQVVEGWHRGGSVGFKIGPRQLFWLSRSGLLNHFKHISIVNSLRTDRVAQAVSLYIARHTGQWQSNMEKQCDAAELSYSAEQIVRALRQITDDQSLVEYYAHLHEVARIEVVYEDMLAQPDGEVRRVLDFLALPVPLDLNVDLDAVNIQRQSSSKNAELVQLFRRDFSLA